MGIAGVELLQKFGRGTPALRDQHAWDSRGQFGSGADQIQFERGQDYPGRGPGLFDRGYNRCDWRATLELDLDNDSVAGDGQNVDQEGDSLGAAQDAEVLQFGPGFGRQAAAPSGQPEQAGVMKNDGDAITGELYVQLQAVDFEGDRALKGGEGIFRSFDGGAAMSDDQRFGHEAHKNGLPDQRPERSRFRTRS